MSLVKANSRSPIANEGDLYALLGCCAVGRRRLTEMMREFEIEELRALSEHIIDTSERASTAAVRGVPEGVYYYEMAVDGYEDEVVLKAHLTVRDGTIDLDFSGTSPCSDMASTCRSTTRPPTPCSPYAV